jgi:queuine tRNA-ribosyltransferase/7-cyano-7-deazaguanine tRNA-ribosyltransferase
MLGFEIVEKSGQARAGRMVTPHGTIKTPAFVPVGTLAAVKGLSAEDLQQMGTQAIIANTYHIHLQPGEDTIEKMGGLHKFMGWNGPLMTDSGGFQVFSLGAGKVHGVGKMASIFPEERDHGGHFSTKKGRSLVSVNEEGASFISYLDGSKHHFSPENVIAMERKLGADIILPLDECTSPLHDHGYTKRAMERTHRWALRALAAFQKGLPQGQALFGIIQGGAYKDLRKESAGFIAGQDFDGYAIGGSLGESTKDMDKVLSWTMPLLPEAKPRHLLGIGEVEDIFDVVKSGIDLFDCVAPISLGRTGTVFVKEAKRFRIHLRNARFRDDPDPIETGCRCPTCRTYSRAYLRHLLVANEPSAGRLATMHNLYFLESLMENIRQAVKEDRLGALKQEILRA